jgi:hypothetical protein
MQFIATNAMATIPDEYNPVVIEPPSSFSERVVDLTKVVEVAKQQRKNIWLYLGAADCPPCRKYHEFLRANFNELKDDYSKYIIVDIRTWVKGPELKFKVGDKTYTYKEFNDATGSYKVSYRYPHYWALSPELKSVKELHPNEGILKRVEDHLEFIRMSY